MIRNPTSLCILCIWGLFITGCGPSAEEQVRQEKIRDSAKTADSLSGIPSISKNLSLKTRLPGDKQFIKTAETRFMVGNVRTASDQIEDLTAKYSGYVTYSYLKNYESDYSRTEISRDSVVISRKIIVENNMVLRIPNEKLDSLVRELNKLILFLDYRVIKMDDVSLAILANQKVRERIQNAEIREKQHIDKKQSKLKDAVSAEEKLLNRQIQADYLQIENQAIADQVNYCTLVIYIYQKPVYHTATEVLPNTDDIRPNLFSRILDAIIDGWYLCEIFIVFLFRIWWLLLIITALFIGYRKFSKPGKQ